MNDTIREPLARKEVLNHGFVELIDRMGDDQRICDTARTSYADARTRSENRTLIRYMWREGHTSPFEQVVFTFRVKIPIFVARQWWRHRTARVNEMSGRYSEMLEETYDYSLQGLPKQSASNKQGSEVEQIADAETWTRLLGVYNRSSFDTYRVLLGEGCSKEIARCHLPLSTYTVAYWQMDLHNLLHFLRLRLDSHAQAEIRVYAQAMYEMIREHVPLTIEAFEDYTLNSMQFSAMELRAISQVMHGEPCSLAGLSTREQDALLDKCSRLGIVLCSCLQNKECVGEPQGA